MKLFSQGPTKTLYWNNFSLKQGAQQGQWRSPEATEDIRSNQEPCLMIRTGSLLKAQSISKFHAHDVEKNHRDSNLRFKGGNQPSIEESKTSNLPTALGTPQVQRRVLKGRQVMQNTCTSTKQKTTFGPKELDNIFLKLKDNLCLRGILKEEPLKEVTLPGTYLPQDQSPEQIKFISIKEQKTETLITLATESKESSMSLQCIISDCSPDELSELTEMLSPHFSELINHRFGSFVLQRLLVHFNPSFNVVESLCRENFKELILNEYSSRVIQLLIEKSRDFGNFALFFFKSNFDQAIASSSACHLLVACLKNGPPTGMADFIICRLKQKPSLLGKKFFHRVLLTYLNTCTESNLDKAAAIFGVFEKLTKLFNRRATTTLVQTLLQRNHQPTIDAICYQITNNPKQLFETLHFSSSMHKLVQDRRPLLIANFFSFLVHNVECVCDKLRQNSNGQTQFWYLLLSCCSESDKPQVVNLIEGHRLTKTLFDLAENPENKKQSASLVLGGKDSNKKSIVAITPN